jgi:type IV pilus assembly protein PilE
LKTSDARTPHQGYSLVELLIALLVLAIVSSLSVAGYSGYSRRANRVDATAALLKVTAAQEKFYLQNGSYADEDQRAAPPPEGLGIPGTELAYYDLEITPDEAGLGTGYRVTATAASTGPQQHDEDCAAFSIDQSGNRSATDRNGGSGRAVTDRCWR